VFHFIDEIEFVTCLLRGLHILLLQNSFLLVMLLIFFALIDQFSVMLFCYVYCIIRKCS
jgi:hypothetical protein